MPGSCHCARNRRSDSQKPRTWFLSVSGCLQGRSEAGCGSNGGSQDDSPRSYMPTTRLTPCLQPVNQSTGFPNLILWLPLNAAITDCQEVGHLEAKCMQLGIHVHVWCVYHLSTLYILIAKWYKLLECSMEPQRIMANHGPKLIYWFYFMVDQKLIS